jgi:hypothetical protein
MFDLEVESRKLPSGWAILDISQHPLHRQLVVGFPNGYALSMVQGQGTYQDAGEVEIGYGAWNKDVDNPAWALVSFSWARDVMDKNDSVQGWVPLGEAETVAEELAGMPVVDFGEATADDVYDDYVDDDSYDEYPEERYIRELLTDQDWFDTAW